MEIYLERTNNLKPNEANLDDGDLDIIRKAERSRILKKNPEAQPLLIKRDALERELVDAQSDVRSEAKIDNIRKQIEAIDEKLNKMSK